MRFFPLLCLAFFFFQCSNEKQKNNAERPKTQLRTTVSIKGDDFLINGVPTLKGVVWNGISMEGLLPNARMVQGIFDDLNPQTAKRWIYADTQAWDADRNTEEFVAAMESWYVHGLLAFTINMQGGSPTGYGNKNWHNSAFRHDGTLRQNYMNRLKKILDKADELGMVVIVGLFYFGQDQHLTDQAAVRTAVDQSVSWILDQGYQNVMIEIANECNNRAYDHDLIKQEKVHELIMQARQISREGRKLLVATSFNGNTLPPDKVIEVSDFILIHGNGVRQHERITEMVNEVRAMESFKTMPILFNEDDHYDFDKPMNNMIAAFKAHASWGYFDYRRAGEGFEHGFQSVPVDWKISSDRKRAFFEKLREVTGR
jgi:hypothetical protein